ncbi:HlyD family type I secretion periplasmic adaptor subunit [Bradyrhizobium sp.]|uniref:HlyD family type I secretion periplasmic adaptor subunit n=1 Tax=Bradyrhizobium sp. TaxID=376 RepID=UPI00239E18D4|nr:HlyD family type I secretion periplasmic adaptor subunit [Bradyrhizobium sp.]MDE2377964.1 HlyD family type I secretion periplasmic adaptor subunit [Bradyrhizobium sp.]
MQVCSAHVKAGAGFLLGHDIVEGEGDAADALKLQAGRSYREELRTGLRVLLIAAVLGGGWLTLMPLAGAVVVPGNLVVQSNVKAIQHPTGGIVAEIKVANGAHVAAGDLLVRLNATQAQAGLQMISKQLDELRARIARLVAERDGLDRLQVAPALSQRSTDDNVRSLLASEEQLFKARFSARKNQKDLLQSRIAQLTEEISGLEAQVDSKAKQIELISGELAGVQELYDKRLVPLARLTALQRENARIEGERGQLISAIAETKSKIGEAQLQIVRLDQDFRTDVVKELGETQAKEAELVERGVAARDQLDRIEIRAPTSGVVHQLAAHTIGGVIRAGDTIMEIVPDTDALLVEARLQPKDIDQVRTGQKAFVHFSAFNQRVTPQLAGEVSFVSADTSRDPQTSASYFTVQVVLPDEERRRLGGLQLVPGMPAEIFMQTGSRTMMSYLLQPITEQMHRAFVEQ